MVTMHTYNTLSQNTVVAEYHLNFRLFIICSRSTTQTVTCESDSVWCIFPIMFKNSFFFITKQCCSGQPNLKLSLEFIFCYNFYNILVLNGYALSVLLKKFITHSQNAHLKILIGTEVEASLYHTRTHLDKVYHKTAERNICSFPDGIKTACMASRRCKTHLFYTL